LTVEAAREFVSKAEANAWTTAEPIGGDCEIGADGCEVAKDGLVEGAEGGIDAQGD
jgi:hypothetical protein